MYRQLIAVLIDCDEGSADGSFRLGKKGYYLRCCQYDRFLEIEGAIGGYYLKVVW